jgi:predicted regulator of Ras-like GTPase activity (Roadblock/LC7/MglB family)
MFSAILRRIVEECGGGTGAVLMGYDGMPVDQYLAAEAVVDHQQVAVEFISVVKEVRSMVEMLSLGALEEVAIRTDRLQYVVRIVTPDYFVATILLPDGNLGKARYLISRETANLRAALA